MDFINIGDRHVSVRRIRAYEHLAHTSALGVRDVVGEQAAAVAAAVRAPSLVWVAGYQGMVCRP